MKNIAKIILATICINVACSRQTETNSMPEKHKVDFNVKKDKQNTGIKFDSFTSTYNKDSTVKTEGGYVNSKKEGVWKQWRKIYGESDTELITTTYMAGVKKREVRTLFFKNSKQLSVFDSTEYIKPDSALATVIAYYNNGQIQEFHTTVNAYVNGIAKIWAENGNLIYSDSSNYGKCVLNKTYNPQNNVLILEEYFGEKCQVKLVKEYDKETGVLINEKKYNKTCRDEIEYNENGEQVSNRTVVTIESLIETHYYKTYNSVTTYKKEIKKSFAQYNKAGKLLYEEMYDKNEKVIKKWGVKLNDE